MKNFYEEKKLPIGSQLLDWTPKDLRKKKRIYDLEKEEVIEGAVELPRSKRRKVPLKKCIVVIK